MDFFQSFRLQLLIIFISSSVFGQIETGKTTGSPEKKIKKTKNKEMLVVQKIPTSAFYVGGSFGLSSRLLSENEGLFGKSLGERANEKSIFTGGATIGFRNQIKRNWWIDFGASLAKNGESYDFKSTVNDSSYSYKTNYTYFAIPIKLQYMTAGKVKFIAGVGVQPQLFMSYNQKINWTDSLNVGSNSTIKDNKQINFFTIAAIGNIGLSWQMKPRVAFYLLPEIRMQLNNSFQKQSAYIHKGLFYGVQAGFSFGIN
jgi:hypothetical protein